MTLTMYNYYLHIFSICFVKFKFVVDFIILYQLPKGNSFSENLLTGSSLQSKVFSGGKSTKG